MFTRPSTWVTDWWLPVHMWPIKILEDLKKGADPNTPRTAKEGVMWHVKLEKWTLATRSWWANPLSPLPPPTEARDFSKRTKSEGCKVCARTSYRLFNEMFICLYHDCTHHWCNSDGTLVDENQRLTYTTEFLTERSDRKQPCMKPEYFPDMYEDFQFWHGQEYINVQTTTLNRKNSKDIMGKLDRGFKCPYCGMVNRRYKWHEWRCRNLERCNDQSPFSSVGSPPVLTVQQSSVFNTIAMPDFSTLPYYTKSWHSSNGLYNVHHFDLGPGCEVFYLQPNPGATAYGHGADYFYGKVQELANEGKIHLEKRSIATQGGHQLTGHFADNFGEAYYLAVVLGTTCWEKAPLEIQQARYQANAITREFRKEKEPEYNELYIAGYWQGQSMNWHDDGEHGLDQKILTWSLGGQGTFSFRLKSKIRYGRSIPLRGAPSRTFITDDPVLRGSEDYEARKRLKEQLDSGAINQVQWQSQFEQLMGRHGKSSRVNEVLLSFPVNHGCIILMNGVNMQRYYDHSVNVQNSPLRFALTFRHITPQHELKQSNVTRIKRRFHYDQHYTPDAAWDMDDNEEVDLTIGEPAPDEDQIVVDPDETDVEPEPVPVPESRPSRSASVPRRGGGRQRGNAQRAASNTRGEDVTRRSSRRQPKRGR